MQHLIKSKQPRPFVLVVEGLDFSGKTTLVHEIQYMLINESYRVKLLHDPRGTKNAQVIWDTILTLKKQNVEQLTEFFLFLAARHELIAKEAMVNNVDVIIFDRFIFSTIAYQLTDKPDYWEPFVMMHRFFSRLMPDLCIYCDIDFDLFQLRHQIRHKQDLLDQMSQSRFEAVKRAYDEALALKICPYLRTNRLEDNHALLMKNILAHL